MFSQSITIIFINGKATKPPADFIKLMMDRWKTLIFSYRVTTELELSTTIEKIERSLIEHRKKEYKKLGFSSLPDNVDLRPGIEFGNAKIIIDDLHKEVVKSSAITRHFQSIPHSGIELIFVTQSFKNINSHDQIKKNISWVLFLKTCQNQQTLRNFLSDIS